MLLNDLKGKKVAVGAAGSTERTAKILLEAHGLTSRHKTRFLNFGEAVTALKDRLIDCAIVGRYTYGCCGDASATLDIDLWRWMKKNQKNLESYLSAVCNYSRRYL